MRKNIPNIVTSFRLFFGLIMIYLASLRQINLFVIFYVLALVTDVLDGFLARKLRAATKFGAKFDALADNFIVICIGLSFLIIHPLIIKQYSTYILALIGFYFLVQSIAFLKTKELIFMRNYSALLAAIVFPILIISLLFFEIKVLIYLYVVLMFFSLTEKLFLKISGNEKKPSIFTTKSPKLIMIFLVVWLFLASLVIFFSPSPKVCLPDKTCITIEIRDTQEERRIGLMYRENLPEDQGMLFVFENQDYYTFWMKNMKISIDMIYLNSDKVIVYIVKNAPPCDTDPCVSYKTNQLAQYVLETTPGFSEKHGLHIGDQLLFT